MGEIQDGSAVFKIMDERENEMNRKFVDLVYPVGIVVALANDKKPAFMEYGTWEKVAEDRVLQGSSDSNAPGKKIEAGLPNIKGDPTLGGNTFLNNSTYKPTGAFYKGTNIKGYFGYPGGANNNTEPKLYFDASKSNEIYGASDTVQPAAYVVAYWQRTE